MALFDVPGWSIPDEPVAVSSKKRNRVSKQNIDKVQLATANMEKLMMQLAASPAAESTRDELKEGKGEGVSADGDRPPEKKRRRVKRNKSQQQSSAPAAVQEDESHKASRMKGRKDRRKETPGKEVTGTSSPTESRPPPESRSTSLTSLQHGMKQSLDGARFRYVIHHNFHALCPTLEHAFQYPAGGSTRSYTSQTVPRPMP
jgi:ribosomal RNA-processing protein 8